MTRPQVTRRPFSTDHKQIPARSPIPDRRSAQKKDRRAKVEPYSFSPLYVPCSSPLQVLLEQAEPPTTAATPTGISTKYSKTSDVLQSWKEISAYIKRSVRTCQRWESEADLPVHRPRPGPRSPVFGLPAELDFWLKQQRVRRLRANTAATETAAAMKPAIA